MKKRFILWATFALTFCLMMPAGPVLAQAPYTITFDEYSESHFGAQIDEEYVSLGIHFTTDPPTSPPVSFHPANVFTKDTWANSPFSFTPLPTSQFLAMDKPQGQSTVTGVGMIFDYYCTKIAFDYRRPGNNAVAYTLVYVQLFDTTQSGEPFYSAQIKTVVKPPDNADANGYLPFSLTAPAPFNMLVLSGNKKFQIDNLAIAPVQSGSATPTLDQPQPNQTGNVVAADQSFLFGASTTSSSYIWSGTKPDNSPLPFWDPDNPSSAGGIDRETGLFVAPSEGNFAGSYQITVEYQPTGLTQGFTAIVPVQVVADDTLFFMAGDPAGSFHAYGADAFDTWEFFPVLDTAPGTISIENDGGSLNNKLEFTPAGTLTEPVVFRLEVVSADDPDQEYTGYSPKVYVLPIANLAGRLSDPDSPGLDWSTVHAKAKLLKAGGEPTEDAAADGTFSFNVPKAEGLGVTYTIMITADGYITRTIKNLSAGEDYGFIMEPKAGSISGNVKSSGTDIEGVTVVAYKEVSAGGNIKKEYSNSTLTDADGNFTINLEESTTDHTVDGIYTVIATKNGYDKQTIPDILVQESLALADVDATDYAGLNVALTQKTRVLINRKEWDHDANPTTPMVIDLSFTAQQTAFTDVADLTGPALVDLTVGDTHTTNLGSLGALSLAGSKITCRYTPHPSDDLIGIRFQAYADKTYKSDVLDYTFLVHPGDAAETRLACMAFVDPDAGGTLGDADETAIVVIPFNGLTDSSAAAAFIERINSTDTTIQMSDVVEIVIMDSSGNDLGNIINADNPLEITMAFDPATFDPSDFTIYYRNKQSNGAWDSWIDGVEDGSVVLGPIDLANHTITFTVTHLSGFGVGASVSDSDENNDQNEGNDAGSLSPLEGGGVGGAGCFIGSLACRSSAEDRTEAFYIAAILILLLIAGGCAVIRRLKRSSVRICSFLFPSQGS